MRPRIKVGLARVSLSLLLLLSACSESLPLPAGWQPEGPIDCRAELSAPTIGLMQPVDLTIWSYFEGAAKPTVEAPPIPPGFVGEVETQAEARDKGWLMRRVFHLRPTKLGTVTIESMKIGSAKLETTTPALKLEVTSVLGGDHDPKAVEDPAAPFPEELSLRPFFIGAGVLGVLLLLIMWWRRRSRRVGPLHVEVPPPPHAKALRALERLRHGERTTEAQIELFYVGVSDVLRVYLEERFGLHAPLRSTEEFLADLEAGDDLSLSQRQSLRQFLNQCDLVKFARMFPGIDVHEQTLRIAEHLVEQTRADVVRDPQPAPSDEKVHDPVGGAA